MGSTRGRPTDREIAEQLRARLLAVSWWRGVMQAFPGGVVQVSTASRVLNVTRQRVDSLIDEGRIPLIVGMPGGNMHDRFVPLDALPGAPTHLETGRSLVMTVDAKGNETWRRREPPPNPWGSLAGFYPQMGPGEKISSYSWEPALRRLVVRVKPDDQGV